MRVIVAAAVVMGGLAGCLDVGAPPMGRHLLVDRTEQSVELVPGPVGQPSRILLSLWKAAPNNSFMTLQQISALDDPGPDGGPGAVRVLADQLNYLTEDCRDWWNCQFRSDTLGRLWLDRQSYTPSVSVPQNIDEHDELLRVDPATGITESFGGFSEAEFSPDRTRMWFSPPEARLFGNTGATVVDVDGTQLELPRTPVFVDNDLVFFTGKGSPGHGDVVHRPPGSQTNQLLLSDIAGFTSFDSGRGPLLVVNRRPSIEGIVLPTTSVYDVTTKTEAVLPLPDSFSPTSFVPSPSGRYLMIQGRMSLTGGTPDLIFDRDTGGVTGPLVVPPTVNFDAPRWRPAHDELWLLGLDGVFRWRPGGALEPVGPGEAEFMFPPLVSDLPQEVQVNEGQPVFMPDGGFRIVMPPTSQITGRDPVSLQLADDPMAPLQRLNGVGTSVTGLWPLRDGRLLVEVATTDAARNDIDLVDPVARTSHTLARTGYTVATGRDRSLAVLHFMDAGGSGDLVLIDYATGAQTLIAQNVFSYAVDTSPVPDDELAPGTRVVYLVKNRIASPYDGVWSIDLP